MSPLKQTQFSNKDQVDTIIKLLSLTDNNLHDNNSAIDLQFD